MHRFTQRDLPYLIFKQTHNIAKQQSFQSIVVNSATIDVCYVGTAAKSNKT